MHMPTVTEHNITRVYSSVYKLCGAFYIQTWKIVENVSYFLLKNTSALCIIFSIRMTLIKHAGWFE